MHLGEYLKNGLQITAVDSFECVHSSIAPDIDLQTWLAGRNVSELQENLFTHIMIILLGLVVVSFHKFRLGFNVNFYACSELSTFAGYELNFISVQISIQTNLIVFIIISFEFYFVFIMHNLFYFIFLFSFCFCICA